MVNFSFILMAAMFQFLNLIKVPQTKKLLEVTYFQKSWWFISYITMFIYFYKCRERKRERERERERGREREGERERERQEVLFSCGIFSEL